MVKILSTAGGVGSIPGWGSSTCYVGAAKNLIKIKVLFLSSLKGGSPSKTSLFSNDPYFYSL